MSDDALPTAEDIVAVHDDIEREYDLKYKGARVTSQLRCRSIVREATEYGDVYMRGAFLLRKIATAHLFEDANKRTAWNVATSYLERAGAPRANSVVNEERVVRSMRKYEVEELANWLKLGEIDQSRLNPPRTDSDK
jgi:prophage maintenance system killer protein